MKNPKMVLERAGAGLDTGAGSHTGLDYYLKNNLKGEFPKLQTQPFDAVIF